MCTGDSLTHGVLSADWTRMLERDLGRDGYGFVNTGRSGDLAENVLRRLDETVACDPDVVTVLVGTNDVAAHISDEWMQDYLRKQQPSERPSLAHFEANLRRILERLRAETRARVLLIDLPLLTEHLAGAENRRVEEYNAVLRRVAGELDVEVLALNAAMRDALPPGHRPPPFDGGRKLMGIALLRRYVLRQRWDAVSTAHGFALLTDHVHLNGTAGRLLADLVAGALRSGAR